MTTSQFITFCLCQIFLNQSGFLDFLDTTYILLLLLFYNNHRIVIHVYYKSNRINKYFKHWTRQLFEVSRNIWMAGLITHLIYFFFAMASSLSFQHLRVNVVSRICRFSCKTKTSNLLIFVSKYLSFYKITWYCL